MRKPGPPVILVIGSVTIGVSGIGIRRNTRERVKATSTGVIQGLYGGLRGTRQVTEGSRQFNRSSSAARLVQSGSTAAAGT